MFYWVVLSFSVFLGILTFFLICNVFSMFFSKCFSQDLLKFLCL